MRGSGDSIVFRAQLSSFGLLSQTFVSDDAGETFVLRITSAFVLDLTGSFSYTGN